MIFQVIHTAPSGKVSVLATATDRFTAERALPREQAWVDRNPDTGMEPKRVTIRAVDLSDVPMPWCEACQCYHHETAEHIGMTWHLFLPELQPDLSRDYWWLQSDRIILIHREIEAKYRALYGLRTTGKWTHDRALAISEGWTA